MNYIDIEPDPNAPAVPPAYDPNPCAYSDIKPEILETYDILAHNRGHVHPSPGTVSNNGTYSRLNIETTVYDKCQHNGDATMKPRLSHHSEYSQLNVGQQMPCFGTSLVTDQYSSVALDRTPIVDGIPLVQKSTYIILAAF